MPPTLTCPFWPEPVAILAVRDLGIDLTRGETVSYTHLDVYKRQGVG